MTQTDIDNGQVTSQATVVGYYGAVSLEQVSSPIEVTIPQVSGISLVLYSGTPVMPIEVGSMITYSFQVNNTGNLLLTNVTATDPLHGISLNLGTISTTSPYLGSYQYMITATDLLNGIVTSTLTVSGQTILLNPVTSSSATTVVLGQLGLSLNSYSGSPNVPPFLVGDPITYSYSVTNTGTFILIR